MSEGLPRVTAILKGAGLINMDWATQDMMDRGTAVHLACQFLDEDDLDVDSLADDVRPRLEAYRKWKAEMKPRIVAIEQAVEHPTLRYCGRLDRIVEMGGYGGVLDIKGPARASWHGLQVEFYRRCVDWTPKRWTLHLADDGYTLIEHTSRDDWPACQAALTLYQWRRNHNA